MRGPNALASTGAVLAFAGTDTPLTHPSRPRLYRVFASAQAQAQA